LTGQLEVRLIGVFLKALLPESWRLNLIAVWLNSLLSSAQTTFAAPRWSMSIVKKSPSVRPLSQPRPERQIGPMWFGWSEICTDLKFGPVLSAFWDCEK
jgi:hypothetical protein